MKLLLITLPTFFDGETDICNQLFADGLQRLHLRKPGQTSQELGQWIEHIAPQYRSRIVVHHHHELASQYQLGGLHYSSKAPFPPDQTAYPLPHACTHSRSCHSIEEAATMQMHYDYVFLSPIFDSISKPGYKAAFTRDELISAAEKGLLQKVYALGGITPDRLPQVKALGFCGAAMMGGAWELIRRNRVAPPSFGNILHFLTA